MNARGLWLTLTVAFLSLPPPPNSEALAGAIDEELAALDQKTQDGTAETEDYWRISEILAKQQEAERRRPKHDFLKPKFKITGQGGFQQGFGMAATAQSVQGISSCGEFKNVYYDCTTLPWDAVDAWTRSSDFGAVSVRPCTPSDACKSEGVIGIDSNDALLFWRVEEGLVSQRHASATFRMKQTLSERNPQPDTTVFGGGVVWIDDGVKSTAVGFVEDLNGDRLVFMPTEGHLDPTTGELNITEVLAAYHDWSVWHDYRLVRDNEGMIELFADGDPTPVVSFPYASLNIGSLGGPVFMFGNLIDGEVARVLFELDSFDYSVGMPDTDGCWSSDGKLQLISLVNINKVFNSAWQTNDISAKLRMWPVDGLQSNTQRHTFYLRSEREIRDTTGNLVRVLVDQVRVGPVGASRREPYLPIEILESWDGLNASGQTVAPGVYDFKMRFSAVREDGKGSTKTTSMIQAAGGATADGGGIPPGTPLKPAACDTSNWTEVPYYLAQKLWKRSHVPWQTNYQHNMDWEWPILMSANVNKVRFHYNTMQPNQLAKTADSADYFILTDAAGDYYEDQTFPSAYSKELTPVRPDKKYSKVSARFYSDAKNADRGVWINRVEVKCDNNGSAGNTITLDNTHEIDVVLLSAGDTVFFDVKQPANIKMSVLMNAAVYSPAAADFNIYASHLFPTPSPTASSWKGDSPYASEAFWIPAYGGERNIHFAVTSKVGKGHVRIHVTPVMSSIPILKVCTQKGFNASNDERYRIKQNVMYGVQMWYGMTDAQNSIEGMALFLSGDVTTGCDVLLVNNNKEGSSSDVCSKAGQTGLRTYFYKANANYYGWDSTEGWSAGSMLAHELGHLKGCLGDEYDNTPLGQRTWCGHSVMANQNVSRDFCGSNDHKKDGQTAFRAAGAAAVPAAWDRFSSIHQVWIKRTGTADPSDFYGMINFDKITPVAVYW